MTYLVGPSEFNHFYEFNDDQNPFKKSLHIVTAQPFELAFLANGVKSIGVASYVDDDFPLYLLHDYFDNVKDDPPKLFGNSYADYLKRIDYSTNPVLRYTYYGTGDDDAQSPFIEMIKFRRFARIQDDPPTFACEILRQSRRGKFEGIVTQEFSFNLSSAELTARIKTIGHDDNFEAEEKIPEGVYPQRGNLTTLFNPRHIN